MKKVFAVICFSTLVFLAVAPKANAAVTGDDWKFEPTLGPILSLHNWGGTRFGLNAKIGKENFGGLFSMAFAGANAATLRFAVVYDYPFYFTFSKKNDFNVGPTVDVGPSFGFGGNGNTTIGFLPIGFGCRTAYQITDTFGVVAELVHFTMSFVSWTSGAGTNTGFAMSYDMKFGVYLLF